ncbi:isochorismatase family protein [Streptomyces beigongshangae]|uniref:isochorismatase family protein n=1 Tax=Streptomyces beigongshangae TaxID=2841597 RepID=UPI001C84FED1|nr:isochorismatase family protein [Streptomyces sp. REN17]
MNAADTGTYPVLDPARTALVLIDLMDRIVGLPMEPRKGPEVLSACEKLIAAFRAADAPVVLVRAERPGVAEQPPGSGLVAGLAADGDIEIVKRTFSAFQDTGLDERLRERGVTTVVIGGIATNLGVESTGRVARDLGYDVVFVEDTMATYTTAEHEASVKLNFPRLGTVVTTAEVSFTTA